MSVSKIMVVDDSEEDQFLCEYVIKKYDPNIEITKAYHGQEAMDVLEGGYIPQVILLDINMPVMNGHEFLDHYHKLIKAQPYKSNALIIMLSSSNQTNDRSASQVYDMVKGYIAKPLEVENLEQVALDFDL